MTDLELRRVLFLLVLTWLTCWALRRGYWSEPARRRRVLLSLAAGMLILACSLAPSLVPEPTLEPAPTATPAPTPMPRHVALPPPGVLADMVAAEAGDGFRYLPWHYVAEDSVVWLVFGWPEEDDRVYKAVFGVEGGEWALLGVEPVGEEGREALDMEADDGKANTETPGLD